MMIRLASPDDASAIAAIHISAWQVAYAGIVPADFLSGMSLEKRTLFWAQELAGKRSKVIVAVENDKLVGWVSGGESRDADTKGESEVYAIYVSPDHWTRGIGRRLMAGIEAELPPFSGVTLWVLERNETAIGFYRRIGYEFDGAEKTLQIGGEDLSEVRLRKKVSPA